MVQITSEQYADFVRKSKELEQITSDVRAAINGINETLEVLGLSDLFQEGKTPGKKQVFSRITKTVTSVMVGHIDMEKIMTAEKLELIQRLNQYK